jgi:sulfur carrier protein
MRFFMARRRHFFVTYIVINLKTRSMKLKVNDKEVETGATHLSQFSQEQNLPTSGIAVAVNNRMVPRAEWNSYVLNEGDNILIIKAVCGG